MSLIKECFEAWWSGVHMTPGTVAMFTAMIAGGIALASTEGSKKRRANDPLFRFIAKQWGKLRKS